MIGLIILTTDSLPLLVQTLEDVLDLIKENVERNSSPVKLKILLNQQLAIMTESVNDFISNLNQTSDEKIEIIVQSLTLLTKIINAIPNTSELSNARYEFITLSNFVRMSLANYSADSGRANVISSASLLSQLLVGDIPHIDKLEKLPSLDEYTHFKENYYSVYNTLQSTMAFYNSLLQSLNLLRRDSAVKWFNEVLWHGKLIIEHYKQYPLRDILERRLIRNWNNFYNNLFTMTVPLIETLFTVHEVFVKFGGNWPDEINDYDLIRVRNAEGLIELSNSLKTTIQKTVEILDDAYKQKLINLNDFHRNHPNFSIVTDSLKEIDSLILEVQLHQEGVKSITIDRLQLFLDTIEEILNSYIEYGGGYESIRENFLIDQIVSFLSYLLPYHAVLSAKRNSIKDYESYLYKHSKIINFIGFEDGSTFHFKKILAKIYVYSRTNGILDVKETIDELLDLKDYLGLKPREQLMTLVLLIILAKAGTHQIDEKELIDDITSHVFFADSHIHIKEEFMTYIYWLCEKEPKMNPTIKKLLYRQEYRTYDIITLLIPDFKGILGSETEIQYIPFNRELDGIY